MGDEEEDSPIPVPPRRWPRRDRTSTCADQLQQRRRRSMTRMTSPASLNSGEALMFPSKSEPPARARSLSVCSAKVSKDSGNSANSPGMMLDTSNAVNLDDLQGIQGDIVEELADFGDRVDNLTDQMASALQELTLLRDGYKTCITAQEEVQDAVDVFDEQFEEVLQHTPQDQHQPEVVGPRVKVRRPSVRPALMERLEACEERARKRRQLQVSFRSSSNVSSLFGSWNAGARRQPVPEFTSVEEDQGMKLSRSRSDLSLVASELMRIAGHALGKDDGQGSSHAGSSWGRATSTLGGSSNDLSRVTSRVSKVRQRTDFARKGWVFLEEPETVRGGRAYMRLSMFLLVLSAVIPVFQSIEPPPFHRNIAIFEIFLDVLFISEVIFRFWCCPNRSGFLTSPYTAIDVISFTNVVATRLVTNTNLFPWVDKENSRVVVAMVCFIPIFRLMKCLRRFERAVLLLDAFRLASEALPMLIYLMSIFLLATSGAVLIAEQRSNDDSRVQSMPQSIWFTLITMTTVGYGDITPTSAPGYLMVAMLIVFSALYMAIPIGIVGNAFSKVWDDRDRLLLLHRTRVRLFSSGYRAEDVPAMFFFFDKDGDGELTLSEFLTMMTNLQVDVSATRLVQLFETFDRDGSGAIDDSEFVRTLFPQAYAEIYGHMSEAEGDDD